MWAVVIADVFFLHRSQTSLPSQQYRLVWNGERGGGAISPPLAAEQKKKVSSLNNKMRTFLRKAPPHRIPDRSGMRCKKKVRVFVKHPTSRFPTSETSNTTGVGLKAAPCKREQGSHQ